jgi:hypothetical protein
MVSVRGRAEGGRLRRTIRWVWNGLTALSLLLCAAALAAWPASYWLGGYARVTHELDRDGPPYATRAVGVDVGNGGMAAWVLSVDGEPYAPSTRGNSVYWHRNSRGPEYPISIIGPRTVEWGGFQAGWEPGQISTEVMRWLTAPLWAWALAFGLLPGWRAAQRYRGRRARATRPGGFAVVVPADPDAPWERVSVEGEPGRRP